MKIAIITDTHYGVRGDSQIFASHFRRFYEDIFFPTIDKMGIKVVFHLGDLVDRRKHINFLTAKNLEDDFIAPLAKRGVDTHIVVGNHDTYHKNTNEVNSLRQLYSNSSYPNLHIYDDGPVGLVYGGLSVILSPWICSSNYEASMKAFEETDAKYLMGHFEIKGFEMMRGQVCDHGLDRSLFKKFEAVYSGHFHHPSEDGNIKYLGAPYEMNWSDYDGRRGFHVLDTETKELEFIANPYRIFHKIGYDDTDMAFEDVENLDFSRLTNAYVKVMVKERSNPQIFDSLLGKLQSGGAYEIKVVEDAAYVEDATDDDILSETQDTLSIIQSYINAVETKVDKQRVSKVVRELYNEAINL